MIHTLFALLDLLTNCPAMAALIHQLLTFGLANTGIACLLGSFEIVRRCRFRRDIEAQSHA